MQIKVYQWFYYPDDSERLIYSKIYTDKEDFIKNIEDYMKDKNCFHNCLHDKLINTCPDNKYKLSISKMNELNNGKQVIYTRLNSKPLVWIEIQTI